MENQENKKKAWLRPSIETLNIKKDTFSGTANSSEKQLKAKPI